MAREFKELSGLKQTPEEKEAYRKNFNSIDWSVDLGVKIDKEKVKRTKKHITAGLCGEYGMSEVTSRGGIGPGREHKDPELFPCAQCNYQSRFKEFCESCLHKPTETT